MLFQIARHQESFADGFFARAPDAFAQAAVLQQLHDPLRAFPDRRNEKTVDAVLNLAADAADVAGDQAMDRWTALAMLESGGDNHTIGRAGEISRYQIRRELWPGGNPLDNCVALANAQQIMSSRAVAFERSHGHAPDDFEFYVLWNAPAQIDHPHHVVAERARRFVNLVGFDRAETNTPNQTRAAFKET